MTTARAILLAACLISAAIVVHAWMTKTARYSLAAGGMRLDVFTGHIVQCNTDVAGGKFVIKCGP